SSAKLSEKSDEALEKFFAETMRELEKFNEQYEENRKSKGEKGGDEDGAEGEGEEGGGEGKGEGDKEEKEGSSPSSHWTPLSAHRIYDRIKMFESIHSLVLNERFDDYLADLPRAAHLPSWWRQGHHDQELILALDQHGLNIDIWNKDK